MNTQGTTRKMRGHISDGGTVKKIETALLPRIK